MAAAAASERASGNIHPCYPSPTTSGRGPLVVGCRLGHHGAAPPPLRSQPALLADRDGVLVRNRDSYILDPSQVTLMPGAGKALRSVQQRAIPIVIVSNQSAPGRGLITVAQAVAIHRRFLGLLAHAGVRPGCSLICPHHPEDHCHCRKPEPGMLAEAAAVHGLDLARSCLIGDARSDVLAARRASVGRAFLVTTGRGAGEARLLTTAERQEVTIATDVAAAASAWLAERDARTRSCSAGAACD